MGVTIYLVTGDDPPSSWKIFANPSKKIGNQPNWIIFEGGDPNHLQPPVGLVGWSILPAGGSASPRCRHLSLRPCRVAKYHRWGARVQPLVGRRCWDPVEAVSLRRWLYLFWKGEEPNFSMFRMFNGLFLLVENGSNLKSRTCLKD